MLIVFEYPAGEHVASMPGASAADKKAVAHAALARYKLCSSCRVSPTQALLYSAPIPTILLGQYSQHALPVCAQEQPCRALARRRLANSVANMALGPVTPENVDKVCGLCMLRKSHTEPKLLVCGRCLGIRYCNKACQAEHWPVHKLTCTAPSNAWDVD